MVETVNEDVIPDPRSELVLPIIEQFTPTSVRSSTAQQAIIELLTLSPDAFERNADIHHITASAIVVSARGVLLHRHKLAGIWMQPGGHVDPGELPAEAARREVLEETAIAAHHRMPEPEVINLDVHVTVNRHVHYDIAYLMDAEPVDPAPPAGESPDAGWFLPKEALAITDSVCRDLIIAATARRTR